MVADSKAWKRARERTRLPRNVVPVPTDESLEVAALKCRELASAPTAALARCRVGGEVRFASREVDDERLSRREDPEAKAVTSCSAGSLRSVLMLAGCESHPTDLMLGVNEDGFRFGFGFRDGDENRFGFGFGFGGDDERR